MLRNYYKTEPQIKSLEKKLSTPRPLESLNPIYQLIGRRTSFFLCLVLCLFGCPGKQAPGPQGQPVIRVDNHVLTLSQFNEFFEPLKMSYGKQGSEDGFGLREARARFLLELIEEMIILRRAEELGLHVSSTEFQEALEKIEGDYDRESLQNMFMRQAISLETWKERIRRQLLVKKALNQDLGAHIFVTPEEMRRYYDEHHEEWRSTEQVRVRQILLAEKKQAEEVLKKINNGEDFAELAKHYSVAPEAKQGGDMGFVARGDLPESLEAPIFSLKQDKVSPVIRTQYGYHIFEVIGKKPAGQSKMEDLIEEIRERVKTEKIETAYGPWLADLRYRYKITVNKEII